jgi:hypothetical protein
MDSRPSDETLLLAVAERDMVMLGAPGLPRGAAWWGLVAGAGEVLAPGLVPRRLRLRAFRPLLGVGPGHVDPAAGRTLTARADQPGLA